VHPFCWAYAQQHTPKTKKTASKRQATSKQQASNKQAASNKKQDAAPLSRRIEQNKRKTKKRSAFRFQKERKADPTGSYKTG
jgi:hypothetical protein